MFGKQKENDAAGIAPLYEDERASMPDDEAAEEEEKEEEGMPHEEEEGELFEDEQGYKESEEDFYARDEGDSFFYEEELARIGIEEKKDDEEKKEGEKESLLCRTARQGEKISIELTKVKVPPDAAGAGMNIARKKNGSYELLTGTKVDVYLIEATNEEAELLKLDHEMKCMAPDMMRRIQIYRREKQLMEAAGRLFKADSIADMNDEDESAIESYCAMNDALIDAIGKDGVSAETAVILSGLEQRVQKMLAGIMEDTGITMITSDAARKLAASAEPKPKDVIKILKEDLLGTLRQMVDAAVGEKLKGGR